MACRTQRGKMEYLRIAKDGIHLFAGKVGTIILTMVNLMILTRIFTTEDMGRYSLFVMVVSLALTLGLSWSDSAVVRHGREEFLKKRKINESFWARFYLFLPVLIVFSVLLLIFNRAIADYIGTGRWVVFAVISFFVLNGMVNNLLRMYQSIDQMCKSAYILFFQKVIHTTLLFAVLFGVFPGKLSSILIIINVSFLIALAVYLIQFDFRTILPYRFNKNQFRRTWSYSWPHFIGFSGLYIVNYIDLYVIRKYMTLIDVGLYSVAYNGFVSIMGIIMLMNTVMMPLIVEYRTKKDYQMIRNYLKKLPLFFSGWAVLVVCGVFLSGIIIPLLFSDKYVGSIPSFNVLLVTTCFYFLSIYLLPLINAFDLVLFSQIFNLVKSGVNVLLDFSLIPQMGIIGAAYATLAAYALGFVLSASIVVIYRRKIMGI